MKIFAKTLLTGQVARTAARLSGRNPIVRTGAVVLASRWAMRSIPTALALVAAGAAARHFMLARRKKALSGPRSHQLAAPVTVPVQATASAPFPA